MSKKIVPQNNAVVGADAHPNATFSQEITFLEVLR